MYKYIVLLLFIFGVRSGAQELNCVVKINSSEIGVSNKQVFVTMQSAIFEYLNNTKNSLTKGLKNAIYSQAISCRNENTCIPFSHQRVGHVT